MAYAHTALGDDAQEYEAAFRGLAPAGWEIDTFEQGKVHAQEIAASS